MIPGRQGYLVFIGYFKKEGVEHLATIHSPVQCWMKVGTHKISYDYERNRIMESV